MSTTSVNFTEVVFSLAPVLGQVLDKNEAFSLPLRLQKTDLVNSIDGFYLACIIVFRNFITMNDYDVKHY
jgi:hypothetical protein